jgi:hypothetical protein
MQAVSRLFDTRQTRNNAQFSLKHFGFGVGQASAFFSPSYDKMNRESGISRRQALFDQSAVRNLGGIGISH